jgi:hypothetical protein
MRPTDRSPPSQRTAQKAATVRRDGSFFVSPWRRLAEALEAGEVVDVGGWEIKSGGRTSTLDSATGSRRTARRWPSRTTPTHEGDDERTDSLPTI